MDFEIDNLAYKHPVPPSPCLSLPGRGGKDVRNMLAWFRHSLFINCMKDIGNIFLSPGGEAR